MPKTIIEGEANYHKIQPNTEVYCEMLNIDIAECKKNLKTKFKKNTSEASIFIFNDCIKYNYKRVSHNMEGIINPKKINMESKKKDKQQILVHTNKMININYPIVSLRNFLMHIKGKINIVFGNNMIYVEYKGDGILLKTEIKTEHIKDNK